MNCSIAATVGHEKYFNVPDKYTMPVFGKPLLKCSVSDGETCGFQQMLHGMYYGYVIYSTTGVSWKCSEIQEYIFRTCCPGNVGRESVQKMKSSNFAVVSE